MELSKDKTRPCTRCEGTGKTECFMHKHDPVKYPDPMEKCFYCDGRGIFEVPDVDAILRDIVSHRGASKGRLLRSRPDYSKGKRAYFVWRMARFHGGADVCMPVCAEMDVHGDPYEPELNSLAEAVARKVYGTDLAAAMRWGRALGYVDKVPEGLPASAYEGGPAGTDIGDMKTSPEFHIDEREARTEGTGTV